MIAVKRVYDEVGSEDGFRILVDRLWPRGISKERARIDEWMKDVAPSDELRRWYLHDPQKWPEFKKRYGEELRKKAHLVSKLRQKANSGRVTLLYAAKDEDRNNAVALREIIQRF